MNANGLYTVERRGSNYVVYSPSGSKIKTFFTYEDAKKESNLLNKGLKKKD